MIKNVSMAQTLNGKIVGSIISKDSKEFLVGASITVGKINGIYLKKSITDSVGKFEITTLDFGKYIIEVNSIGYSNYKDTITINEKSLLSNYVIQLKTASYKLQEITVSGIKAKPFISFVKGSILLDVQNSPLAVGSNGYDVLLRAPGLSEQNENLSFRTKTVNVLINGRPSNLTGSDLKTYLSAIPSSQISKIEIIPNPSAKYDSQGGSVVNIILKRNETSGLNGTLTASAGAGRFLRSNTGITLNYGTKKVSTYTSYDFTQNGQYYDNNSNTFLLQNSNNIQQNEYEVRNRYIHTGRLGADYDINTRLKIGGQFRGFWNYGNRTVDNKVESFNTNILNGIAQTQTNTKAFITNPYLNGYLEFNVDSLGKKLTLNVDLFRQQKNWDDTITVNNNPITSAQNIFLISGNQPTNINTQSFSADYINPLVIGKIEAGFKIQFTNTKNNPVWQKEIDGNWVIDNNRTFDFLFNERIYAAYLNWNTTLLNILDINLGLRSEKMDINGFLLNQGIVNKRQFYYLFPTIGLEYQLSKNHILNANYRKNLDRFSFNVVNPFKNYINPYFTTTGNPSIKPEVNHDMEVTYTYKQALVFGASYTKTKDVISPVNIAGLANEIISTYDNLPSSEMFYFFANIPYRFRNWFGMNLSGGYGFYKFNTLEMQNITVNKSWSYLTQAEMYFNLSKEWKLELSAFSRGPYASGIYVSKGLSTLSFGLKKSYLENKLTLSANLSDMFNTNINIQTMNYRGIISDARNKPESRFASIGVSYNFGSQKKKAFDLKDDKIQDFDKRM